MITTFVTALIMPIFRWRDVVKVFAASAGAGLLGRAILSGWKPREDSLDPLFFAAGLIFVFLIGSRAAVHWHRVVILDEPAPFVPPMPNVPAIHYSVWAIWILLVVILFMGAIVWLVAQWDLNLADQFLQALRDSVLDADEQTFVEWLVSTSVFLIACFAIALIAGELLLVLPRTSIAESRPLDALQMFGVRDIQFPIAVVAMIGVSPVMNFAFSLISLHGGAAIANIVVVAQYFANLWLSVALLTLLSLIYMRQIPDEEAAQS